MKKINTLAELEVGKSYLIFQNQTFELKLTMRSDGFMEPIHGRKIIAFNAKQFFQKTTYEVFGPADHLEHDYVKLNKRIASEGAGEKV